MFRLKQDDLELLVMLADYRLLSTQQMAVARGDSEDTLAKRIKVLEIQKLVRAWSDRSETHRGRPRKSWMLVTQGISLLKEHRRLPPEAKPEQFMLDEGRNHAHTGLLNWAVVRLLELPRLHPQFNVAIRSSEASGIGDDEDRSVLRDQVRLPGVSRPVGLQPDAAFCIRSVPTGQALLFLLEVDRGTESLSAERKSPGDVHSKIARYQSYFREKGYKRYEGVFNASFRGFRVLVLAATPGGLSALCGLVRQTPPSDFIWLANVAALVSGGIHERIWARGGRDHEPAQSILGSQFADRESGGSPPG